MPRRRRYDLPGFIFHIMNRGLAKRTVFETRDDIRFFLMLLACEVRAGRIEIFAHSILTTHFHLVVRSRTGEIHRVMQRVENLYVRYFNRTRRRDGPLFRSRYLAKRVTSLRYFITLIRYLDQNPTGARLVHEEVLYPYGSAFHYASRRRPPWLSTTRVDALMGDPEPEDRLGAYRRTFGRRLEEGEIRVIERRLLHAHEGADDWDGLIGAAPPQVLDWMRRKARLADGTKPGLPYADAEDVARVVARRQGSEQKWLRHAGGKRRIDAWPVLRVGVLRDLAGLTLSEVHRRTGYTVNVVVKRIESHEWLLANDDAYAARASEIGAECLAAKGEVVKGEKVHWLGMDD